MALKAHERTAIAFLLRHLLVGSLGGFLFGALLLFFDIGHLWTLIATSGDGILFAVLLFFGLFVTFGGVAMAVGIMSQEGEDR